MAINHKDKIIYVTYIVVCIVAAYLVLKPKQEKQPPQQVSVYENKPDEQKEIKKYLPKDSLIGYWMVVGIGNDRYNYVKQNETNYDLLYDLKYMPVYFSESNEKIESYSSDLPFSKLTWYLKNIDTLIEYNKNIYRKYEIVYFKNETLKLNYCAVDSNNNPINTIYFTLCRIHPERHSQQSLFSSALSLWRNKIKNKKSQQELKLKLKSLLQYNSIYLRSIHYSNYQALNTKHLHLPFDYYSNNMLFKTPLNSDNFNELFADTATATIAYQLLKEASKNLKYPSTRQKDDYILEYANYIDSLEKRITK